MIFFCFYNNFFIEGLEPPPPPLPTNIDSPSTDNLKEDLTINLTDDQSSQTQTPTNTELVITTNSLELTNIETHSPLSIHSPEQTQIESIHITLPTPQSQQKEEESEQVKTPTNIQPIVEQFSFSNSPLPKPPRQNLHKEKKSSTIDGLLRIINDHTNRIHNSENNEKQTNENISYFRVAKSRCGKFETDSQGFVNNTIAIFDSTNQPKIDQPTIKNSHPTQMLTNSTQQKSLSNNVQHQTKGKQAYNLLKKYEREEQLQSSKNIDYLKPINDKEKSPTPPIQVEFSNKKFLF